jgi:hypothetical protein
MTPAEIILLVILSPLYLGITVAGVGVVIVSWICVFALLGNQKARDFIRRF